MVMTDALIYTLELSLVLCALYAYYRFFLAKEHRYRVNRLFLLGSLIAAAAFPLVEIPNGSFAPLGTLEVLIDTVEITSSGIEGDSRSGIHWLFWVYITGFSLTLTRFSIYLGKVFIFIKRREIISQNEDYTLIHTGGSIQTCSFFHYLFWNETLELTQAQRAQMIAHEVSHIKGRHSWDLMFLEVAKIVLWFHPVVYLLRRDLVQTHEYIADQEAANQGSKDSYLELLLTQMFGQQLVYSHSFFHSPLKKRIMMLNQKERRRLSPLKYLLILPLLAGLVFAVGCSQAEINEQSSIEMGAAKSAATVADQKGDNGPTVLNLAEIRKSIGYPKPMQEEGIEGMVVAKVLVGPSGEYREHEIVKTPHEVLEAAVAAQLPRLKFEPGVKDGKPVSVWVTIPFKFKLSD
jgi:TonB family protein